ncbi:hypothetical protein ACFPRL_18600 [Pseudoclavibacter helvolus]
MVTHDLESRLEALDELAELFAQVDSDDRAQFLGTVSHGILFDSWRQVKLLELESTVIQHCEHCPTQCPSS